MQHTTLSTSHETHVIHAYNSRANTSEHSLRFNVFGFGFTEKIQIARIQCGEKAWSPKFL